MAKHREAQEGDEDDAEEEKSDINNPYKHAIYIANAFHFSVTVWIWWASCFGIITPTNTMLWHLHIWHGMMGEKPSKQIKRE